MPENKPKTNAINLKDMSPQEKQELFAKWKRQREQHKATRGNNKTNKTQRTNVKENKRTKKEQDAIAYWKANPNKKHSMKYGVNPNNPNKEFIEKTAYDGSGFGENDKISKAFTIGAGTLLTGGVTNALNIRGLNTAAKTIKYGSKGSKIGDI